MPALRTSYRMGTSERSVKNYAVYLNNNYCFITHWGLAMFKDRFDAAHQLVPLLKKYSANPDAVILAVPRGGLQLGYILARELHLPLDAVFTKKIGYPTQPEFAIGAVSAKHIYISPEFADLTEFREYIEEQALALRTTLLERAQLYRGNKPPLNLTNKIVIIVDDGVATGHTLLASLALIQEDKPQKIVVALPVAPPEALERLREHADEVVCLSAPQNFLGVGQFYENFEQVDDKEAIRLLHEANL